VKTAGDTDGGGTDSMSGVATDPGGDEDTGDDSATG
jgi:hypothetical protein